MFDWEDEEITNIIWGEEDENKEAANVKLIQNTSVSENITDSVHAQSGTHRSVSSDRYGSLLDLSSSKMYHERTDEKAQVDNSSQIIDNQAADRDRSNFVDYGWANVRSFDDLDRMLSNHDLELWPSTKDVTGCSENPEMLYMNSQSLNLADSKTNNYLDFETKSGDMKDEKQTNNHGGRKTHKQKLGIQMRVCIRESLFRLAQGALQRKNDGSTNKKSNDGTGVVLEGVSGTKSSTNTQDAETKTNPIDRVVASLLFHTPTRELVQSPSEASATPTMNFF